VEIARAAVAVSQDILLLDEARRWLRCSQPVICAQPGIFVFVRRAGAYRGLGHSP